MGEFLGRQQIPRHEHPRFGIDIFECIVVISESDVLALFERGDDQGLAQHRRSALDDLAESHSQAAFHGRLAAEFDDAIGEDSYAKSV